VYVYNRIFNGFSAFNKDVCSKLDSLRRKKNSNSRKQWWLKKDQETPRANCLNISRANLTIASAQGTSKIVLSMAFLLLIEGLSKKNCLFFNENLPAEKAYRLLESISATKYSRHKQFIDRTQENISCLCRTRSLLFCHAILTIKSKSASVRILPAVPE